MEVHQLRYFVAAAEVSNISRAAQNLHVSQPALSRQIGLLEEELGVKLFSRIRQRVQLTEAGRFFHAKARQILCDMETTMQQTREQFGGVRKTLRLGYISPFLDDLVAPSVHEFRQRHANTAVSLFELAPAAQLERLYHHELDAAILGNLDARGRAHFQVTRLASYAMALVLPTRHASAGKKSLKLAAFADEAWVSLANAAFPERREYLQGICRRAGFEPRILAEVDSLPMLLATVATTGAVAVLPAHAQKIPHAGCVFVPMSAPRLRSELFFVSSPDALSPELIGLRALLVERAEEMRES